MESLISSIWSLGLIKAKNIICSFIFLVIGQLLGFFQVPAVPLSTKGILKSLRKLMMAVLSKGILACTCMAVRLQKRRGNCSTLIDYEFPVQRSEVGSPSLPSLDFYDTILITLELRPKGKRTEYRRPFSPSFPWHAGAVLWSLCLCCGDPEITVVLTRCSVEFLCPCTRIR